MVARPMRARFAGDLQAPSSARIFVTNGLEPVLGNDGTSTRDDIVLIVSELVTNSVLAGAAATDVQVDVDAARVDVRVTDAAPGWPILRPAAADDVGGRGLSIIGHLADSVSTLACDPGKTVTASW